jgi:hypothetical protein
MRKATLLKNWHFTWVLLAVTLILHPYGVIASDSIFVRDDFSDFSNLNDLSRLVIWGDNKTPVSCFALDKITDDKGRMFQSVFVTDEASPYSTYHAQVNGKPSLRTMSCFDYEFPNINRHNKTIKIEFDAFWKQYDSGYGEQGRIVVTLVHDYPEGGPSEGDIDKLNLEAPFGRPAYNVRLRNSQPVKETDANYVHRSPTFMLYGGGLSADGEFEKSTSLGYWMPGFSSEAGGGAPGQPSASDYPNGAFTKKSDRPWQWNPVNEWYHYTWIIDQEVMSLYMRPSNSEEKNNQLVSRMAIPRDDKGDDYILDELQKIHAVTVAQKPAMYKWYESFNAIRVYFRAFNGNIAYMANFTASYTREEPPVLAKQNTPAMLTIYPNPTSGGYIRFNQAVSSLQIFDLSGRMILDQNHISENQFIDISTMGRGVYVYRVVNAENRRVQGKLMVY